MQGNPVFMEKAIALATENVTSGRGGPFGAVIVRDGEIVATGVNMVTATNDPTAHAEVVAIRECVRGAGEFSIEGLQDLYELRALSDVPGGDLLGAVRCDFLWRAVLRMLRRRVLTMRFLYDEMKRPLASARFLQ